MGHFDSITGVGSTCRVLPRIFSKHPGPKFWNWIENFGTFSTWCLSWFENALKERYWIGKKTKSWRSQIYIKLIRSNDDDSRKHPLKYFCLKCHIWWEINNLTLHLEFIAQWAFYSFFLASMSCKMCNRFFTISSWPRWPIDLKLLQVCKFM